MKKRFFAFLLGSFVLPMTLFGCGKLDTYDCIMATDMLTGACVTVDMEKPVKSDALTLPSQMFATRQSLEELAQTLSDDGVVTTVKRYPNDLIAITTDSSVFLILSMEPAENQVDEEKDYWYAFFAAVGEFALNDRENTVISMHIPFHLFADKPNAPGVYIAGSETTAAQNNEAENPREDLYTSPYTATAAADIEAFYEFYDHIASTSVERQGEDTLLVTENANGHTLTLTFAPGENENDAQTVTFTVH